MLFRKPLVAALLSAAFLIFPLAVQAMLIDKQLVLRPIQICNNLGDCANDQQELFENVGDFIWSQAGIDLKFEEFTSVVDQQSFDISFSELTGFRGFDAEPGPNWFVNAPGGTAETNVINLWFTNSIEFLFSDILGYADADVDATGMVIETVRNNILISDLSFDEFFPRTDVIAHEIGHILGLNHCGFNLFFPFGYVPCEGATIDAPDNLNLMQPTGGVGALSVLTTAQIAVSRQSRFLVDYQAVPLPATWLLLLFGILLVMCRQRLSLVD